jgi:hypothetical protein
VKQEVDDPIAALQPGPSASKRVTFGDQQKESVDQDDEDAVQVVGLVCVISVVFF